MQMTAAAPAQDTARRVTMLLRDGVTLPEIAEASGLSIQALEGLAARQEPISLHVKRGVERAWTHHMLPVPSGQARQRVRQMLTCGFTADEIAAAAHLPADTVTLLAKPLPLVSAHTDRAIETAWTGLMNSLVPVAPTRRRIRELLDLGFGLDDIADAAGLPAELIALLDRTCRRILPRLEQAVRAADVKLMGPPVPPDDIDDVLVERIMTGRYEGRMRKPERREAVRRLYLSGLPIAKIAEMLQVTPKTAAADLDALGVERRPG
jgi:DNA-binding NarL/FixJ family response regulator